MFTYKIGIEAEMFLKNKKGDLICPHYSLPIDGNGVLIEIRGKPADNYMDALDNFFRRFEEVKELCYPCLLYISPIEKSDNFLNPWIAYKASPDGKKINSGLHLHLSIEHFGKNIDISELKNEFRLGFETIFNKHSKSKKRINYINSEHFKKVKEKPYGLEFRNFEMSEDIFRSIKDIVKDFDTLIQNNKGNIEAVISGGDVSLYNYKQQLLKGFN